MTDASRSPDGKAHAAPDGTLKGRRLLPMGRDRYAVTTYSKHAGSRLARDAEGKKEMPSVAIAVVIDRSGSMTGLPIEMAKSACKATVTTLEGDDLIEIIAFDSTPIRYVKFQPARYRSRINNEIARVQPGGGTEIFPAIDMAYQDISVVQARKKHVILLTDGRSPTQAEGRRAGDDRREHHADHGGPRRRRRPRAPAHARRHGWRSYHAVPDPNSLPKIFTRETEMIARQAAVEEWFPVQVVTNADFLKGISIGSAPLLHGYVATQMKEAPAQLILAADTGEPILARWRVGLGYTLAWTSDIKTGFRFTGPACCRVHQPKAATSVHGRSDRWQRCFRQQDLRDAYRWFGCTAAPAFG